MRPTFERWLGNTFSTVSNQNSCLSLLYRPSCLHPRSSALNCSYSHALSHSYWRFSRPSTPCTHPDTPLRFAFSFLGQNVPFHLFDYIYQWLPACKIAERTIPFILHHLSTCCNFDLIQTFLRHHIYTRLWENKKTSHHNERERRRIRVEPYHRWRLTWSWLICRSILRTCLFHILFGSDLSVTPSSTSSARYNTHQDGSSMALISYNQEKMEISQVDHCT